LATGLFASKAINPAGADGLFFGNPGQLWTQVIATVVTAVFSFVATLIILKVIDLVIGIRVQEEDEIMGLDLSQHNETGYTF
ncbi:MAG: ammonia channel protein, partial [Nitrospirota bacterium]